MKLSSKMNFPQLLLKLFISITAFAFYTTTFAHNAAGNSTSLVLNGAHIIGQGEAAITIRNGRIESIGENLSTTKGKVIDFQGKYIVPGFIDSHVHLAIGYEPEQLTQGGIIAAVDLAAPLHYLGADYDNLQLILSGPMVTAKRGYPIMSWGADGYGLETSGVDSARKAVDFLIASGAKVIKIPVGDTTGKGAIPGMEENKSVLNDAELKAIVEQTHSHGLRVVAHAITDDAAMRAAKAGVDVLSHTPTVVLSEKTVEAWSKGALMSSLAVLKNAPAAVNNLRRLREAGTTILYGTDLGYSEIPGVNVEELKQLQKAGLDGDAILRSVTETPAKYWGFEGLGVIKVGARATLLILDADPREDLSTLERPHAVYIDGIKLNSAALSQK
jgi:imidazolonepropionase-like amidohydrolase